jgi:uncharacterized protein (TIGR02147 family)
MNNLKTTEILDIYDTESHRLSYKIWVTSQLDYGKKGGRGARKLLAEYASCQVSHVANVLNGEAHFSLEQAERVASFFELSERELTFFLLLVQHNRAGSKELSAFFQKQIESHIEKVREARRDLKERVPIQKTLGYEDQAVYYSSWQYAAVHVLLSVPGNNTAEVLTNSLPISRDRMTEILEFLCHAGLAVYSDGQFTIGPQHLHLASDSPFLARHHMNWRNFVSNQIELSGIVKKTSLHYSSVVTISEKDVDRVREILTRSLADSIDLIKASPEQRGAVLNIDWMPI